MVPQRIVALMVAGGAMAAIGIVSFYGMTARYSPVGCAVLVLGGVNLLVTGIRAAVLRQHAGRAQRA